MEDLDPLRTVPGAGQRMLAALTAFGLEPDETVVWQSDRLDRYESAFEALRARAAIYPCHCSRNDLSKFNGIHPSECVTLTKSDAPAWR